MRYFWHRPALPDDMRPGFCLLMLCAAAAVVVPRMAAGAVAAPSSEGATNLAVYAAASPNRLQFSVGLAASKAQLDSAPISKFIVRRPRSFHVATPRRGEKIGTLSYGRGGSYFGQPQIHVPLRGSISELGGYRLAH